jgi:hypothetical protein
MMSGVFGASAGVPAMNGYTVRVQDVERLERSVMKRHRLLLLVLTVPIMIGAIPAAAAPGVAAPAGLAHWWPANGTPADRIGRSGRAALSGGATYGPGVRGTDQAFSFNGSGAMTKLHNYHIGNFGTSDFTLFFFIKTTSTRREAVWQKRGICDDSSFWGIELESGGPFVPGALAVQLDQYGGTNEISLATTIAVNDGAWHSVAVVRQATTLSMYIDGALNVSATNAGPTDINNGFFTTTGRYICTRYPDFDSFTGSLDEQMMWSVALSQDDIQALIAWLTT